jgi:hypothetical protein
MNYQEMTKKQLDKHAETIGIKLDGRKSKKDMIAELNKKLKAKKAPAKKPVAKKAKKAPAKKPVAKKAKNSLPPAPRMAPTPVSKQKAVAKKGFWASLKGFFG